MTQSEKAIRSYADRILRLKEEQDALGSDVRDIYAEAKGNGFDKGVLGRLVTYIRKRTKDGVAVQESDALFELYLAAYDGETEQPSRTHAGAREAIKPSGTPDGGYSADPEAQKDSVSRSGARNGEVDRPSDGDAGRNSGLPHSKPRDAGPAPEFLIRKQVAA